MLLAEIVIYGSRIRISSRARSLIAAAAAACLLCALAVVAWPGNADSAPLRVVELGKTSSTPKPDCPGSRERQCQTVGRVTGFQSISPDAVKPFQVPFDGKIVSWSMSLSRPSKNSNNANGNEQAFFNQFFGKPSTARLAILKRVPNAKPAEYKLVRQSPVQILNPYFGNTVTFALDHPLNVVKDQMVGLTIPTWAPAFYHSAACENISPTIVRDAVACARAQKRMAWRASRVNGRCNFDAPNDKALQKQINKSYSQQRVNSKKQYGCYYRGARLLYNATLVKKPRNG